ncbi:MAG: hypothetical protein SX243_12730 [Acidobacteriota bacterium]|nr:hypothetical protein [Acidobacteriota bacterium]
MLPTVKARELWGVGPTAAPWERLPLDRFVRTAPGLDYALLAHGTLPPQAVLNDFLARGESNAGMSGAMIWKPLEVSEAEYDELVEVLCTDPELEVAVDEDSAQVESFEEWVSGLRRR